MTRPTEPHEQVELVELDVQFEHVFAPDRGRVPGTEFAALYEREFQPMVRLATLMCGAPETARDVVQDSFVKLYGAWFRVREPGAYLRRSVVNGCRSQSRWDMRRRGRPRRGEPATEDDHRELDQLLLSLPARQRAALVLRFYEGRTEAEIAEALGCRPGSVGPLIHRGLGRLRQMIDE